jgi:hypothetical protein
MSRALASIGLAVALASCAQTGVLELQLMLPAQPAGSPPLFALVQIRRANDHEFEQLWSGDELAGVPLASTPTRTQISVIGHDPSVDLRIKVRFCQTPGCTSIMDDMVPETWYELEHPFYIGRRTAWAACITSVPAARPASAPIPEDRCQIHGCVGGGGSTSYCTSGGSGPHFCETGSADEPPRDLTCIGAMADY